MAVAHPPIDLTEPRDVGDILGGAFRLYRSRFWLFATIAFSVVVPIDVLVYGVAGELLADGGDPSAGSDPPSEPLPRRCLP